MDSNSMIEEMLKSPQEGSTQASDEIGGDPCGDLLPGDEEGLRLAAERAREEILDAPKKETPRPDDKEPDSERVRDAWDALPGDETAVDFTDTGEYHPTEDGTLEHDEKSTDIDISRDIDVSWNPGKEGYVELNLALPGGTNVVFSERMDEPTQEDMNAAFARISGVAQHYLYDRTVHP